MRHMLAEWSIVVLICRRRGWVHHASIGELESVDEAGGGEGGGGAGSCIRGEEVVSVF